jgi:hypothetical protein
MNVHKHTHDQFFLHRNALDSKVFLDMYENCLKDILT